MFVPAPTHPKILVDRYGTIQYQSHLPKRLKSSGWVLAYLSLIVIIFGLLAQAIAAAVPDVYEPPVCIIGYYKGCDVPNPNGTFEHYYYDREGLKVLHNVDYRWCR